MNCLDAEIFRAHSACCEGYLSCAWITGVGIGHYHPHHTLRIYTAAENVEVPRSIAGFPTEPIVCGRVAVGVGFEPTRPVMGGFSVAPVKKRWAGTLGSTVYCRTNHAKLFLSNFHVLAGSNNAPLGLPIMSPAPADGGRYPRDLFGELNRYAQVFKPEEGTNLVDAAAGFPYDPSLLSDEIYRVGRVYYHDEPGVGMPVVMSGRDGYGEATIFDVNASVKVYGYPWGYSIFDEQIVMAPAIVAAGDSGSVIVQKDTKTVVGLAFSGSDRFSLANKASNVARILNVGWS